MACGIAGWLIEGDGFELGEMQLRDYKMKFVVNPRLDPWKKPVAILVDEGSASTTEILAQGLQDLGVARIFGRTTAGAALPSMIVRLPCGDLMQYAIAGYHSRSGKRLEGAGVVPDEVIPVDIQKIREEGDPTLRAALRWFGGNAGAGEKTSR
jgi:carboxyl-terminal processing protease